MEDDDTTTCVCAWEIGTNSDCWICIQVACFEELIKSGKIVLGVVGKGISVDGGQTFEKLDGSTHWLDSLSNKLEWS